MDSTKICKHCRVRKPIIEYTSKIGYRGVCNLCAWAIKQGRRVIDAEDICEVNPKKRKSENCCFACCYASPKKRNKSEYPKKEEHKDIS